MFLISSTVRCVVLCVCVVQVVAVRVDPSEYLLFVVISVCIIIVTISPDVFNGFDLSHFLLVRVHVDPVFKHTRFLECPYLD